MYSHPERIRQSLTAAPGVAGNLALGAARPGYKALGAAHDGKLFVVTLRDGLDWEVRRDCVYTHATVTLTRGTLVDSSSGAAVDLSADTVLTVGPSGYEADRLLPADLDGNGNALRVTDGNGNKFALLPLDANGNVVANIAHRQNTLANLLALDGLAGEISVATDVDALVVHNGVAGQADAYMRNREFLALSVYGATSAISSGVDTVVTAMVSEYADPFSAFDPSTGVFTTPSGYTAIHYIATCNWNDAAQGSSTLRRLIIQFEAFPGVWLDYAAPKSEMSIPGYKTSMYCINEPIGIPTQGDAKKLRVVLRQNSGSAFVANVGWQIRLVK